MEKKIEVYEKFEIEKFPDLFIHGVLSYYFVEMDKNFLQSENFSLSSSTRDTRKSFNNRFNNYDPNEIKGVFESFINTLIENETYKHNEHEKKLIDFIIQLKIISLDLIPFSKRLKGLAIILAFDVASLFAMFGVYLFVVNVMAHSPTILATAALVSAFAIILTLALIVNAIILNKSVLRMTPNREERFRKKEELRIVIENKFDSQPELVELHLGSFFKAIEKKDAKHIEMQAKMVS